MTDVDLVKESAQIESGVKARQLMSDPWFLTQIDAIKKTAFEAFLKAANDDERRNCQARTLAVEFVLSQLRVEDGRSQKAFNDRSTREKTEQASRKAGPR